MALFRNQLDGRFIVLRPLHAFGRRAAVCQTVMNAPDVSSVHALVRWNRQAWEIVDQSRNGTVLNGARLTAGRWTALTVGAKLRMGTGEESAWSVHDLGAPVTCLFPDQGSGLPMALNQRGNLLPNSQEPEANIFFQEGRWLLESTDGIEPLGDGAIVRTSTASWEFVLCDDLELTREATFACAAPALPDITLSFQVSQNEEHVSLNMVADGKPISLGERIHHYTLVTLARARQQDALRGLAQPSQGWIDLDELSRMLGVEPSYVNIQIFRAKHQILDALPEYTAIPPLVERRRGSLRFGDYRFEIQGGAQGARL
ncbi:FHA domain-containing protein [Delftia sp. PS-11]|uniref:FHA domain-containing protein n=1 Tax=Delftia sp. PS-11 TaxID=2767222 RepID=UPI00245776E6|nr:FHA domain-containing protein [Delftia sp. PS-11]KAJ8740927.1 FHA domain-containing protein [Delftia sp. PS-11]